MVLRARVKASICEVISSEEFDSCVCVCVCQVTMEAEVQRAQGETDRALAGQGTSTEKIGKDLDKAAQDVEKEVKKETTTQQETQVREEPFGCKVIVV